MFVDLVYDGGWDKERDSTMAVCTIRPVASVCLAGRDAL
jgi:hypothetical protein